MSKNINLDQALEYKGYWYLPSSSEKKVAGILTYIPSDKITLELIGAFDISLSSIFETKEEKVIYGKTSDAKEVTLLQCFQCSSINFSSDFPIVTYNCSYLIIGKHINSLDEQARYWVSFRIPELTYWCHPGALTNTVKFDENGGKITQMSIAFNSVNNNNEDVISNVKIDNNTSVLIKRGVYFDGTTYLLNPQFEQYTYVDIIKQSAVSINELLIDIHTFERFISLATFSVVKSSDITFFDKEIFQEHKSEKYYRQIHLIHLHNPLRIRSEQNKNSNFLIQSTAIEEVYPEII